MIEKINKFKILVCLQEQEKKNKLNKELKILKNQIIKDISNNQNKKC